MKINQTDQRILDRKEEIDQVDSNIDSLSESKVEKKQLKMELEEKYQELKTALEQNRKDFLDNKVQTEFLEYLQNRLSKISHVNDIEQMKMDSKDFEDSNMVLK